MGATLYNIRNQKQITEKGSILNKVLSPMFWNWIVFDFMPYNPNGLKILLQKLGISGEGTNFYVRLGAGYGTLSIFQDELFVTNNNIVWRIPYSSITDISIKGKSGLDKIINDTRVILHFNYENTIRRLSLSVNAMAQGLNIPIENNISTDATDYVYNLIFTNINTKKALN